MVLIVLTAIDLETFHLVLIKAVHAAFRVIFDCINLVLHAFSRLVKFAPIFFRAFM